jgi:hypothetical protein
MRITTVARKAMPTPSATSLKSFLFMAIRAEYSGDEYNNSDVIRSIMAVMASHRLMSDRDKGKFINLNLSR